MAGHDRVLNIFNDIFYSILFITFFKQEVLRNAICMYYGYSLQGKYCHTLYDPPRTSARLPLYRQDDKVKRPWGSQRDTMKVALIGLSISRMSRAIKACAR